MKDKHRNHRDDQPTDNDSDRKQMKRKEYEKELRRLQSELCIMQDWIKTTGQRIIIIFEGRDAAGKGGTIKAITDRVSPRIFRLVALPAPSDREKTQMHIQRYIAHFPAAGEVVIFDRSWYNRAGVERVMGFATEAQVRDFLELGPLMEQQIVENGIFLLKYWLEVSDEEQERRFRARIEDPLRQWKLSAMDLPSRERWYEYSRARDDMLDATDSEHAPWYIVDSNDKKKARLNVLSHLLSKIPYERVPHDQVKLPDRATKYAYDDEAPMKHRHWIPARY